MVLVDLNGAWPSWDDIGRGFNKLKTSVTKSVDNAVKTVKCIANDVKEKACNFYNEHKAVINGIAVIAGAVGVTALTVATFGAGGVVTAAVVGASVGVSATATVDMVRGETSSIETYIGSAFGGAVGGILGAPAAIGKVGTTLGLSAKTMGILTNPFAIGATSSGLSTMTGEGLETLTGTNRRSLSQIALDAFEDSILGGILGFGGSKLKLPGVNSGRNSLQAIFFSGIRKLVNGTGRMHLKTALKGFLSQLIESVGDGAISELYNWIKKEISKCGEDVSNGN